MTEVRNYSVEQVGEWRHAGRDSPPARVVARQPDFWDVSELAHAELTKRIRRAGVVAQEYALEARRLLSGEVLLVHGCHRWAVAKELGILSVPVKMDLEAAPGDEAWPVWEPCTAETTAWPR